jgi:guanine deaminase
MEAESLNDIAEKTFGMMILGDDRAVKATYVAGELAYQADGDPERIVSAGNR